MATVRRATEHVEKIDREIGVLEKKYGMSFEQFLMCSKEGTILDQFSYEIERDYLEWDGLVSRKRVVLL